MGWVALVMIAGGIVSELANGLRFEAIWNPFEALGRGAPFAAVVNAVAGRLFLYAGVVLLLAAIGTLL